MANATMTKEQVIKRLIRAGLGLPDAIATYNKLSCNGFYEIERKEINDFIKENY